MCFRYFFEKEGILYMINENLKKCVADVFLFRKNIPGIYYSKIRYQFLGNSIEYNTNLSSLAKCIISSGNNHSL